MASDFLDLNAKYNLAGYNYTLRDLGDGFAMFDGAVNVLDYVMEDYMVLANYVQSFPVDEATGLPTVTAENSPYGSVYGEGRIKLMNGFTDVDADDYFAEAVNWAVDMGIVNGIGDGTFLPYRNVKRAEPVTMLWRAAGAKIVNVENPFTDVEESDYFYTAVLWAVSEGITTGKSADIFDPEATATRAEVVTMLWRAEGEPDPVGDAEITFSDVKDNRYYTQAVLWAASKGITNGLDDGTFGIYKTCERCEMVTFLYRNR